MFQVELELDKLISQAVTENASDIHFDATKEGLLIRFRIDGVLDIHEKIEQDAADKLINRIKILSGMDISEKRLPQDGRWCWQGKDKNDVMLRVSSLPSVYGETIVCRIVGSENCYKSLTELGMTEDVRQNVVSLLQRPYGLLLISGPTGSGKTSTLYALLRLLNTVSDNVISLENPVEADIPGAIQVQINPKAGLTFPKALRAVLRQDPDTIMVGEIRDRETAELAVQAALTGHRVLATIHTNTALGVRERLLDMGIEDYLVRATLLGAIAQRLVRRKTSQGFCGRLALYELLALPNDAINWENCEQYVKPTLLESGELAVRRGLTTVDEVRRNGIEIRGV
ncbi:MAG: type II/IV secretion system protein [Veillonella sp.]|uniref:GspE/PulE family protein n=1 Tax=Veillonella sp. TaxID=1926307 RepID=UPI0025ECFC1F|nr:GspE/PulE family protein [Veillonella sp.]MBE6079380.1 type II/IV secretion system protein [Veillonella sp.]